jgi:hypothetical protein
MVDNDKKFANFNYDKFPLITVNIEKNIINEQQYKQFEIDWLKCYNYDKQFYLLINTKNMGMVNIKYAYKLSKFLNNVKKEEFPLLKYSIIIVNSWYIRKIINLIFKLHKHISTVYIVEKQENYDIDDLIERINNNNIINDKNINIIKVNQNTL